MQRLALIGAVILVIVAAVAGYSTLFTVHQTQQALVLRFGEALRDPIIEPGLKVKMPIVDEVVLIDNRILDLDSPPQEVIAADQKRLVVDAFARYRITNPLKFYQAAGNQTVADSRLSNFLNSSVRRVLGEATFAAIVASERRELMQKITSQVSAQAQNLGVTIVDVRIRRADLPEANSQAVYRRMQTERQRDANQIRARGEEESQRIRSRADREVRVIVAEGNRESEVIRGEGDAERNNLYAESYGRDPEFFAFYRSMQAYEVGLGAGDTRLVLSPNTEFFRYFENPAGGADGIPTVAAELPGREVGAEVDSQPADGPGEAAPPGGENLESPTSGAQ